MMTPEEHSNAIETQWREDEKRLSIIDVADVLAEPLLVAEVERLRGGIADLRDRIIQGANELERMARELEHTTDNVRPHVRLLAKAEGMRVVLDYLRLLDRDA